jgi:hypothetical protein
MQYLCLCYYDETRFDELLETELRSLEEECEPHDEALHNSGRLIVVGSLAPPKCSKVVLPGNPCTSTFAGPYVATHEPVGAFFIVEAKDWDEAIGLASLHPGAHVGQYLGGGIEVRLCESFERV